MHPLVLVPEGRFDAEWFGRLAAIAEPRMTNTAPFRTVFGIVPTEDAAVRFTVERLKPLRDGIVALVDGDKAGNDYVKELVALPSPPDVIIQWSAGWTIEDVVRWALDADAALLPALQTTIAGPPFTSIDELRDLLRTSNKKGVVGLKEDVIAHESILGVLEQSAACVARVVTLCEAMVNVVSGVPAAIMRLDSSSTAKTKVFRFEP